MTAALRTIAAVTATAAAGCGPGLETVHESNVRFEHCYRLDMDQSVAASHREYCWRSWSKAYAHGQPRDKVEYARRRITALESGATQRIEIQPSGGRRERVFSVVGGPDRESTPPPEAPIAAPAPTSPTEPPPAIAPAEPPPPAAQAPATECTTECRGAWSECRNECAGAEDACNACVEDYRGCMRRCFE